MNGPTSNWFGAVYYQREILRERKREKDEKEISKKEQPRKMKRDISRMNGPTWDWCGSVYYQREILRERKREREIMRER